MPWLAVPLISYIILPLVVASMEFIGGRGTVGEDALNEYLVILQLVFLLNIFLFIRKKGFTKDSE